jgi:methylated-DNA-[protein]-cysteine S-methyltransferase
MYVCTKRIDGTWFGVACEGQRVLATNFGWDEGNLLRGISQSLKLKEPLPTLQPSVLAEEALFSMKEIYDGRSTTANLSLNMDRLPAYTQRVLRTVRRVPVGYVASYGGVADAAGGGARAVGNAMASNPFAPIVPCHRVVTANLGLGGYGGSLRVKFELLNREKRGYPKPESISAESGILKVFPVETVFRRLQKPSSGFK